MTEVAAPPAVIVVSDFVCPWCYIGLAEIARLHREYAIDLEFAPFLLDPSTPPEGKPRRPMTQPGDAPSDMEMRGQSLGITFARGRTFTSNSHFALEAAEFASERGHVLDFREAMFKAYFTDLLDIGRAETVVAIGTSVGLDAPELRLALEDGAYRQQVDDGIAWSREIGVTGVPTFVFVEQYGVVGAQDYAVLEKVMAQLGIPKR
jgi:predicted DsbA family dithiol-disulfide isomerase